MTSPATHPDRLAVKVTGADATGFLHGQFCADLESLPPGRSCLTAWCSPKGRVLTTLLAARLDDGWMLVLPGDLAEPMASRLRQFVFRAKVAVEQGGDSDVANLHRLGLLAPLPAPGDGWGQEQARHLVPWVSAATSGEFLPQELLLEDWGGLSYRKGCYPGQEVIARLHFRGAVKRGPVCLAMADTGPCAAPGARIEDGNGRSVGTVLYGTGDSGTAPLLAVVDHAAQDTSLYLAPARTRLAR